MNFFDLPEKTRVNRVVPKNAFDAFTNSAQKQQFTDLVKRITWSYKLSEVTTNLPGKEIQEIQIFLIELKQREPVKKLLEIIDRAIPYPIIFLVNHDEDYYLSTSTKHPHPTSPNISVIDWTFDTEWLPGTGLDKYSLPLRKTLDDVYKEFCFQLSGDATPKDSSLKGLVARQERITVLKREIEQLQQKMRKVQFNKKLELNVELNKKKGELKRMENYMDNNTTT